MTCAHCFHANVCGNYDPRNDVTMCKQFIAPGDVLYGKALKTLLDHCEQSQDRVIELELENDLLTTDNKALIREVHLLRIIKQTLEMASGMEFDIPEV